MTNITFAPLSLYLNLTLLDYIDLPDGFIEKIGIVTYDITLEESELNPIEHKETVFDESEGTDVTVSWIEADYKRSTTTAITLANSEELSCKIPGLDCLEFVLAAKEAGSGSPFKIILIEKEAGTYSLCAGAALKIRFDPSILKPMLKRIDEKGRISFEEDKSAGKV